MINAIVKDLSAEDAGVAQRQWEQDNLELTTAANENVGVDWDWPVLVNQAIEREEYTRALTLTDSDEILAMHVFGSGSNGNGRPTLQGRFLEVSPLDQHHAEPQRRYSHVGAAMLYDMLVEHQEKELTGDALLPEALEESVEFFEQFGYEVVRYEGDGGVWVAQMSGNRDQILLSIEATLSNCE